MDLQTILIAHVIYSIGIVATCMFMDNCCEKAGQDPDLPANRQIIVICGLLWPFFYPLAVYFMLTKRD